MRVRAIGLVGAALWCACATSDEGESSGPPPFTTNPSDDGAGDDDGGTTGGDDDGASSATAPAEDGGSNPTIAEDGPASDTGASIDDGGFDTGLDEGFETGLDEGPFEESGGFGGECCEPSPMPGCADDMVAQCVCAEDPYCCEMEWNEDCIYLVDVLGCGVCFGGESGGFETGGFETGGMGGDCCMPGPAPGCGDPMIEQCVCGDNMDPFCCEEQWDEQCVDEAAQLCGAC